MAPIGSVMQTQTVQNIQGLRGVAVLLVVVFHLALVEAQYGGATPLLPALATVGMMGVDLFFVISGFVMVGITRGGFRQPVFAMRFLYRRASRIYPLYWIYSLCVLAVFVVQPSWVNSSQGHQVDLLASFLLIPDERLPLLMVGWTLIHEVYFYAVFFGLLLLLAERHLPWGLLGWALVVVGAYLTSPPSPSPAVALAIHPLTLEFIAGAGLGLMAPRWRRIPTAGFAGVAILAGSVGLWLYAGYRGLTNDPLPDPGLRVLLFGIPAWTLVAWAVRAEMGGHYLLRTLQRIGDASYSIYLSHLLVLVAGGRLWAVWAGDGIADNRLALPLLLLAVLVTGQWSYRWLERPLLDLTRGRRPLRMPRPLPMRGR